MKVSLFITAIAAAIVSLSDSTTAHSMGYSVPYSLYVSEDQPASP